MVEFVGCMEADLGCEKSISLGAHIDVALVFLIRNLSLAYPLSHVVLLCNKEILFGCGTNGDSQGHTIITSMEYTKSSW